MLEATAEQYAKMNATSFELLSARRDFVEAGEQYIDAVQRYRIAIAVVTALRRGVALRHRDEPE